MSAQGKSTAIADMASDLGTSAQHTAAAPENSALADLFLALDDEVSGHDASTIQPAKRGRGRPAGSISRTTRQLQGYLQARGYRDPAEFLASVVSMDLGELQKVLGRKDADGKDLPADGVDVLKVQIAAARELMPYWHQKLPLQIEHKGEGARPLIMIMDGAPGAARTSGDDGVMSVHDVIEYQQVSEDDADA